jgi:sugar lactone lactonase YvrE
MAGLHQIWRLYIQTREVMPFVGSGRENIDDGPNPRATLAQPSGLTTDEQRLFFADSESSAVRASDFSPEGYTQTLIGEGLFEFGDRDGKGLDVRLQHCLGVAYHENKIYIADTYNNKLKAYDLSTKECITVFGTGEPGELYEPGGLSIWRDGAGVRLYVADTNNHRILVLAVDPSGRLSPASEVKVTFAPEVAHLAKDSDFISK